MNIVLYRFRYILFFIFWLLLAPWMVGQEYHFTSYTIKQGLAQSNINALFQDSRGYVWYGTEGGASRFDGQHFKNYTHKHGLLSNTVHDFYEDDYGRVWMGTGNGLSIYNGKRFLNIPDPAGRVKVEVREMKEDENGKIWIGTNRGILVVNHLAEKPVDELKFQDLQEKLAVGQVMDIFVDDNNNIWIGTLRNGLICLLRNESPFFTNKIMKHHFDCSVRVGDESFRCVRLTRQSSPLNHNSIRDLEQTQNGFLWVATWRGGLNKIKPANKQDTSLQVEHYTAEEGLPSNRLWSVFESHDHELWIGTDGFGICKISYSKRQRQYPVDTPYLKLLDQDNGVQGMHITTFYEDREKNLWMGTWSNGAMKYSGPAFLQYSEKNGLSDNNIIAMEEGPEGGIWMGTWGGGVTRYIKKTNKFKTYSWGKGISESVVTSIEKDSLGQMWIGTMGGGINRWLPHPVDGRHFKVYGREDGLTSRFVICLTQGPEQTLWVGTEGGIHYFPVQYEGGEPDKVRHIGTTEGLANSMVYDLLVDDSERIWAATPQGVSYFSFSDLTEPGLDLSVQTITKEDGLSANDITSLFQDHWGRIWMGTKSRGISVLDSEQWFQQSADTSAWQYITTDDGLQNSTISFLIEESKHIIWAGTPQGLMQIKLDEKGSVTQLVHFGTASGFTGIECNRNAAIRDREGYLWFGTVEGGFRYNPMVEQKKNYTPLLHIVNLRLRLNKVAWVEDSILKQPGYEAPDFKCDSLDTWFHLPQGLQLPHYENHVTFDFQGITTTTPRQVRYKYKLEGFDDSWSPVTEVTRATYANLPPGTFTFKVKACNKAGRWNGSPTTYTFTITSPFWQTYWFYAVSGLLLIGGVASIVKIREKQLARSKRILEKKVRHRTEEVTRQKEELQEKHNTISNMMQDITKSMEYARVIQEAILPEEEEIEKHFRESFIIYQPRDIVSGDFYWFTEKDGKKLLAAVDCTGHGVPGAFMSMIGNVLLNEIINVKHIIEPNKVLGELRKGVMDALRQHGESSKARDGMNIGLCQFDLENKQLKFAGALFSLYYIRNGELNEVKSDIYPIGTILQSELEPFHQHEFKCQKGDTFYLFSDGFPDQFGGPNGKKLNYKRVREWLRQVQEESLDEQRKVLKKWFREWKGSEEQLDDVLMIGLRI